jgi:hypothetical protein
MHFSLEIGSNSLNLTDPIAGGMSSCQAGKREGRFLPCELNASSALLHAMSRAFFHEAESLRRSRCPVGESN